MSAKDTAAVDVAEAITSTYGTNEQIANLLRPCVLWNLATPKYPVAYWQEALRLDDEACGALIAEAVETLIAEAAETAGLTREAALPLVVADRYQVFTRAALLAVPGVMLDRLVYDIAERARRKIDDA